MTHDIEYNGAWITIDGKLIPYIAMADMAPLYGEYILTCYYVRKFGNLPRP